MLNLLSSLPPQATMNEEELTAYTEYMSSRGE